MMLTCRPCCLFFTYVVHVFLVIEGCGPEGSVIAVDMAVRFAGSSVLCVWMIEMADDACLRYLLDLTR